MFWQTTVHYMDPLHDIYVSFTGILLLLQWHAAKFPTRIYSGHTLHYGLLFTVGEWQLAHKILRVVGSLKTGQNLSIWLVWIVKSTWFFRVVKNSYFWKCPPLHSCVCLVKSLSIWQLSDNFFHQNLCVWGRGHHVNFFYIGVQHTSLIGQHHIQPSNTYISTLSPKEAVIWNVRQIIPSELWHAKPDTVTHL